MRRLATHTFVLVILAAVVATLAPAALAGPPPLPLHTLEGYGGGPLTPMAYLVNPSEDPDRVFGKPAMAVSFAELGTKHLTGLSVTETIYGRIELGYAGIHNELGSLDATIRDFTGVDLRGPDMWLHNFNLRLLALKENEHEIAGIPLPAVTVGFHFKYNNKIAWMNEQLGGALNAVGYRRPNSEEFTFSASKTFPEVFNRPLVVTAGMRLSEAGLVGLLGFSDSYRAGFEGSVAYMIHPHVALIYDYRQKSNPYTTIPGLLNGEDDWHALCSAFILNDHTTFAVGWGHFGMLANETADGVWLVQLKHEF